ncbi:hypothetical protein BVI434_540039 [Burkholderia vietnamiensis]|nr:hypothetical protein BVI434_540039 [Burkholderia vietnamiensis]
MPADTPQICSIGHSAHLNIEPIVENAL